LQSGTPLSAIVSADVSGTGSPIVNRPNLVGNPNISNPTPPLFNPAAFQIPKRALSVTARKKRNPGS
jgi:hypothetical protein